MNEAFNNGFASYLEKRSWVNSAILGLTIAQILFPSLLGGEKKQELPWYSKPIPGIKEIPMIGEHINPANLGLAGGAYGLYKLYQNQKKNKKLFREKEERLENQLREQQKKLQGFISRYGQG